jgi:hypothetical protein
MLDVSTLHTRFRRGSIHWYDIIIAGLAGVIVYPDKVLDWVGERTGRVFGLRHVVYVEVIAIGLLLIVTTLWIPVYSDLPWWYPLAFVGFFGLLRFMTSIVAGMFGIGD